MVCNLAPLRVWDFFRVNWDHREDGHQGDCDGRTHERIQSKQRQLVFPRTFVCLPLAGHREAVPLQVYLRRFAPVRQARSSRRWALAAGVERLDGLAGVQDDVELVPDGDWRAA